MNVRENNCNGGAGFIGSNLLKLLEKDCETIVVDNLASGNVKNLANLNSEFIEADILAICWKLDAGF